MWSRSTEQRTDAELRAYRQKLQQEFTKNFSQFIEERQIDRKHREESEKQRCEKIRTERDQLEKKAEKLIESLNSYPDIDCKKLTEEKNNHFLHDQINGDTTHLTHFVTHTLPETLKSAHQKKHYTEGTKLAWNDQIESVRLYAISYIKKIASFESTKAEQQTIIDNYKKEFTTAAEKSPEDLLEFIAELKKTFRQLQPSLNKKITLVDIEAKAMLAWLKEKSYPDLIKLNQQHGQALHKATQTQCLIPLNDFLDTLQHETTNHLSRITSNASTQAAVKPLRFPFWNSQPTETTTTTTALGQNKQLRLNPRASTLQ